MLRFDKYHGLGNDFVVVDGRDLASPLAADYVRRLCDRHRGIGADGVLTIWPDADVAAQMQIQNADGSPAGMCGNGLRCVAAALFARHPQGSAGARLRVRVGNSVHVCERVGLSRFRVEMGTPTFSHADLPGATASLEALDRRFDAVCVHVGNPHAVIFVANEDVSELAARYGRTLEGHPDFPHRVNVSFAAQRVDGFNVAVYERGVGLTLACGSAAVAVAAAAFRNNRVEALAPVAVHLPGGVLQIVVHRDLACVMEGEAVHVFSGEVVEP